MFKEPIFRHGSQPAGSEDDDSDISITSTVESNSAEDQTYLVEKILAERKIDGETKYLVKWEGYPIERCSWEPLHCFANPQLALNWRKEWTGPDFDWRKWEDDREQDDLEREERKRKRARKRERLGITNAGTSPSASPPPAVRRSQRASRQRQLKAMSKRRRERRGAWSSSSESESESTSSSSSGFDEFIVDDGHISLEESDEDPLPDDDSDEGPARRLRQTSSQRKSAAFMDEDLADSDSDQDEPLQASKGRKKPGRKPKEQPQSTEKRKSRTQDAESRGTKPGLITEPPRSRTDDSTVPKSRTSDFKIRNHKSAHPNESRSKTKTGRNTRLKKSAQSTAAKLVPPRKVSAKRQVSPAAVQPPKSRVKRHDEPLTTPALPADIASHDDDQSRTARRSKMQKPKLYENLSTLGRANKPKDRAPPANEAELFRPDELPKRFSKTNLGAGVPQKRKPSTDDVVMEEPSVSTVTPGLKSALKKPSSHQSSTSTTAALLAPIKSVNIDMDIDDDEPGRAESPSKTSPTRPVPPLKLPDFKKLKLDEFRMVQPHKFLSREGAHSAQISPSAPIMSPGMVSPGTVLSPALSTPGGQYISLPQPPQLTSKTNSTSPFLTIPGFEARIEFSDRHVNLGTVRFEGFSSEFVDLLFQLFPEKPTLHISKSLETAYIVKYLVSDMGPPLEHAEVLVNADLCDPFRSSLTLFHGAGVILHTHFTLLIFLASNDTLRKGFSSPQGLKKAQLRAVAYPPLEQSILDAPSITGLPPLDEGFRHYHPNLYSRTLGLDLAAYHTISINNVNTVRTCIVYAPPLAVLEQTELENLLKIHGVKHVVGYKSIPEWLLQNKRPETRVLVHASLKDKLHLLPYIRDLLKASHGLPQLQWHFFGLMYDPARIPNLRPILPSRFWSFGTVILISTEFAIRHLDALRIVNSYHSKKIGSTLLCIPSYLVARVEKYMTQHHSTPNPAANETLALTYELDKKAQTPAHASPGLDGGVIYLPNMDNPGGCEIESLADAFIIFQQNNLKYRRFILCYADNVKIATELYGSISFYDSKNTMHNLGMAPKSETSGK